MFNMLVAVKFFLKKFVFSRHLFEICKDFLVKNQHFFSINK
jgi:hypothetical protein